MAHVKGDRILETATTTGTGAFTLAGAVSGYRAFSAIPGIVSGDTVFYCIEHQTLNEWEVGLGTWTSPTTLARTTVLRSSNGDALVNFSAGTKNVFNTEPADRMILPQLVTDPPALSSGVLMYSRPLAARHVPRFIGPSGVDSALQPAMFANNVTMWLPGTGTTAAISFGVNWTVGATQSHPAIATTNFMTQMKRATYTTTTTSGNAAGVRSGGAICWRGNAANQGGFFFAGRFGILVFQSAMAVWCGLSASTALLAANPSATANSVYCGKDHGDTNWNCTTVDGTPTASKTDSGRAAAAGGAANIFDFYAFCKPNDTSITVRMVDVTDGTVLVNNVVKSTNLPTSTSLLTAHAECRAGSAAAVSMFLNKIYIESDT
jgi:hypothetical protein